jgi:tRNA A-37 threonylcarbamoyl transferase component Bud32/tetratricopeptide (TPR) repeat protein
MSADIRDQLQSTLSGSYTLERELAGGGMSRVFVADENRLRRKVVVKVLSPELAQGISAERFEREIQLAASLQQANIVPVLNAGESAGLPFYTMPFVEGESLRARLGRGPVSVVEAVSVLRDVARALAYAHERGVVHRDIKPDNVLLSGGTAVVTDFGIAKAISAARAESGEGATLTQLGTSIGTPAYISPEQAAGDPDVDQRADIYSFGCMAFELLTGRAPFIAKTPQRLLAAHLSETPPSIAELRPDVPAPLAAMVMRCLEKEPSNRPQAAAELFPALDATPASDSTLAPLPAVLLGGPGMLTKALMTYAAAFIVVAIVAKAAIIGIGLPDWVFPGALVVMALGLPVILFTAYTQRVTRQALTASPSTTPGGTARIKTGTLATLAIKASPHLSWRRTALGGAYAVGGFVLLIGAFMALRAFGIGPAGSLLAAGKLSAKEPLLVTDFKVTNADSTLGRVLGDATKAQLAQSSVITLMSPEAIAAALRRMERPANAEVDLALARELATRNNIKAIVDGEIAGLGAAGYIVSLKLVTTDSAKVLTSFRESATDARGLIDAVDKLSRRLRGRIGESLKDVHAAPTLVDATTASLEALRKYSEGVRAEELEGKRAQAISLLREAVTIDSTFAEAWRKLATVMNNAGRPRASVDSAALMAYRHRMRLPESRRDYIVGYYYQSGPGRDRAKAVEAYEAMLRRGDTATTAFNPANNLALILNTRRQAARAESLYRAAARLYSDAWIVYSNLAETQLRVAKFDAADSTIKVGMTRWPETPNFRRSRGNMLYLHGDTSAYRQFLDSLYKNDSLSKGFARGRLADLALLHGRVAERRKLMTEARGDTSTATPRQRLGWVIGDAFVISQIERRPHDLLRQLDDAMSKVSFKSVPVNDRPYFDVANAYSRAGKPDKARAILAQYEAEQRDTSILRVQQPGLMYARALALLAERKTAEGIQELRRADRLPDGPADGCVFCLSIDLATAFDAAGMADSAIVHYERAINEYGPERVTQSVDAFLRAPFSRRLGELYEQKGDHTKATQYYRMFTELWKTADPELQPQVAEIRRRLARLSDVETKR